MKLWPVSCWLYHEHAALDKALNRKIASSVKCHKSKFTHDDPNALDGQLCGVPALDTINIRGSSVTVARQGVRRACGRRPSR